MIYEHRATFDEMDYAQISFFARHFYWLEHATTAWLMEKQIGFAVLSKTHYKLQSHFSGVTLLGDSM